MNKWTIQKQSVSVFFPPFVNLFPVSFELAFGFPVKILVYLAQCFQLLTVSLSVFQHRSFMSQRVSSFRHLLDCLLPAVLFATLL